MNHNLSYSVAEKILECRNSFMQSSQLRSKIWYRWSVAAVAAVSLCIGSAIKLSIYSFGRWLFIRLGKPSPRALGTLFLVAMSFQINMAFGKNYNEGRSNTANRVYSSDQFPGDGQVWEAIEPVIVYRPPGKAIREQGVQITAYGGQSPTGTPGGGWAVDSFFDIAYTVEFQVDGGEIIPLSGFGTAHVIGVAPPVAGGLTRIFETELLELNLSGFLENDPNQPFLLRESPTKASIGQAIVIDLGAGQFVIESFFDVFTELSLDGGASWSVGTHVPEPSSCWMLVSGCLAFCLGRRRK